MMYPYQIDGIKDFGNILKVMIMILILILKK